MMGMSRDRSSVLSRSLGPTNLPILSPLSPLTINLSQVVPEPRLSLQRGSPDSLGRRLDTPSHVCRFSDGTRGVTRYLSHTRKTVYRYASIRGLHVGRVSIRGRQRVNLYSSYYRSQ